MIFFFLTLLLILLTLASGYCSSSETALFSLSAMKVKSFKSSSNERKRLIAHLLKHPRDLLVTVFMLNTFVNILLQNVSSSMFGDSGLWVYKVGVPLVITLIFGEIIPKNIGLQKNEKLSLLYAPSINFLQNHLKPIRVFFVKLTAPISKYLFFFLRNNEKFTDEEMVHLLEKSEEHNLLTHDEADLLKGYLYFQDAWVLELMQPKEDILFYDIKTPLSNLIHLFMDLQCSRLPVCDGEIDNVIGIITAKKFFVHQNTIHSSADLEKILEKPYYVPENSLAKLLLRYFETSTNPIALAVNEYGSITGLISREDIAECVIGDVTDLRDQKNYYMQTKKGEAIVNGKLDIIEFNKLFHVNLESRYNAVTIGGWLTENMGDIPAMGATFDTNDFHFLVLSSDPTRVMQVYVRKKGVK